MAGQEKSKSLHVGDARAKDLLKMAQNLFSKKQVLQTLHQEIADNFYPERADFTVKRVLGEEFAGHLSTSFPVLTRRELGNAVSAMLRPSNKDWFNVTVAREDKLDLSGRQWLEHKTQVMRRAMYDPMALFVRATKEGDNDFVTFGNAVLSVEINRAFTAMIYRCWHLRDVAWCEDAEGKIEKIVRRWRPTAREMAQTFGKDNLHEKVKECLDYGNKDPYTEFNCMHVVMPADMYGTFHGEGKRVNTPYVSIYIDVDNEKIMEESGSLTKIYVIPRWQTVSGSQYGYSPATVAALPDARLIQSMTLTLLEAGEKAVNPPLIATGEAVRSDISIFAGGITWVESEYDERMGAALRPIDQNYSNLPFGLDMREDIKATIMEAFYLNKLNLPPTDTGDMTAYEVGQRIQEYIRNALPLFEPMEMEYNGGICEDTFTILMNNGAFGNMADMPDSLKGQDVRFQFESPLHDAVDKEKAHTFMEAKAMLAQAAEMDQSAMYMVDAAKALRDTLKGIRVPSEWMRDQETVDRMVQQNAEKQQMMQSMAAMEQGGKAAAQMGKAAKEVATIQ